VPCRAGYAAPELAETGAKIFFQGSTIAMIWWAKGLETLSAVSGFLYVRLAYRRPVNDADIIHF